MASTRSFDQFDNDRILTDHGMLPLLEWRKSANRELRDAAREGDVMQFGRALQQTEDRPAAKKRKAAFAYWQSLPLTESQTLEQLLSASPETVSQFVNDLISRIHLRADEVERVLTGLAILTWGIELLPLEQVTALWRWCYEEANSLVTSVPEGFETTSLAEVRSLTELPLVAGHVFGSLKVAKDWALKGRRAWTSFWDEQTDNDGPLHSRWVAAALPLMQSLARSEAFAQMHGVTVIGKDLQHRLELVAERMLSLATPGRLLSLSPDVPDQCPSLLADALSAVGFKKNAPIRRQLSSYARDPAVSAGVRPVNRWELPDESHQSDWTEWAALRSNWEADVDQFAVRHNEALPYIDVVLNGQHIMRGDWTCELTLDGVPWIPSTEWSVVCVFTDEEADYLELQQSDEARGLTMTRQVVLNKAERFLLLSDILKLSSAADVVYRSTLPFKSADAVCETDAITREAAIRLNKQRIRVLPIAWPQDRFAAAPGAISLDSSALHVDYRNHTANFCLPLVLDAHPARRLKGVDWNRLSVAEDGRLVDDTRACGRRFRIGREQWMYFHNLRMGAIPRTVLGMHTNHESVVCRITSEGQFEPLVQVEL